MKKTGIFFLVPMVLVITIMHGQCKKSSAIEDDGTVYFLVAEINPNHGDSFILPLNKPEDIAAAESIISGAPGPKIVTARIARGSGSGVYKNKDLLSASKRTWSWHVTEFNGFADFTIEILDGWPTYVEEHLDEWMRQTGGNIGFWSYTVTRKVSLSEIR